MRISTFILCITVFCFSCKQTNSKTVKNAVSSDKSSEVTLLKPVNTIPYFKASGAEPFWNLEISEANIRFKTATNFIITPYNDPVSTQDGNLKRFKSETDSLLVIITFSNNDCENSRTENVTSYRVSIDYKNNTANNNQKFEGCGTYTKDFRLHGI